MDDVDRLRLALAEIERSAAELPWARERPWRARTHVWAEPGLPVIDLHDLDVRLAGLALACAAEVGDSLASGSICLVTGRGRHSIGGGKLGPAVRSELRRLCADHGWEWRPGPPGRLLLIADRERAPAAATGRIGAGTWLLLALFVAAAIYACLGAPR